MESASPATASPTSETTPGADVSPTSETTPGSGCQPTPETTPGADVSPTPKRRRVRTPVRLRKERRCGYHPSPAGTSEAQTSPSPAGSPSGGECSFGNTFRESAGADKPFPCGKPGAESTPFGNPDGAGKPFANGNAGYGKAAHADEEWNNETPSENPGGGIEVMIVRNTLPIERLSLKVTLEKE